MTRSNYQFAEVQNSAPPQLPLKPDHLVAKASRMEEVIRVVRMKEVIRVVRMKDRQTAYISLPLAPPKLLLSLSLLEDA